MGRVTGTAGSLLEFEIVPGNTGKFPEFS